MRGYFSKNGFIGAAEILCRIPLIFTVGYLARSVGPEVYGNWALVMVFYAFLSSITSFGLSSSISRITSVCDEERARGYLRLAFKVSGMVFGAAALSAIGLRYWIARAFGVSGQMSWLFFPGLMVVAATWAEGFLDAYFKARVKIRQQIIFLIGRSTAEVLSVVLAFRLKIIALHGAEALVVYACFLIGLKSLFYAVLIRHELTGPLEIEKSEQQSFLRYGIPMIPTVIVIWFVGQGDRLILGHFVDKGALGIYAFGSAMASYMVYLGYAIYPLLLPQASKMFDAGDSHGLENLISRSQYIFISLLTIALAVTYMFSKEIILFTAGRSFIGSAGTLVILSTAVGLEQLFGVYQYFFHIVKKPHLILWLNLFYALILALAVAIAAYSGGIKYAPWGVLTAVVISNIIRYKTAQKQLALPVKGSVLVFLMVGVVLLNGAAYIAADWSLGLRAVIVACIALGSIAALFILFDAKQSPIVILKGAFRKT